METKSAYQNDAGEWIYPQEYYKDGKRIAKKRLLEQINNNPLIQEAIRIEPTVEHLIKEASQQRCVYGYNLLETFYNRYKPRIKTLVGWQSPHKALRTREHYDAVYEAIYNLLPSDETELYPDEIMSNGMYCPMAQKRYGYEYPE